MVWIIPIVAAVILTCVLAVIFCPIGIKVIYDADGLRIAAFAGIIKFRLYPEFDGEKLISLGAKKKKGTKEKTDGKQKKKTESGGDFQTYLSYVRFVAEVMSDFRKKLVIKEMELKLSMTAGDPADLALAYGAAWTAVSNLTALMERGFTVKKRNVDVVHDFLGDKISLVAKLNISITLGRLSFLGVKHLIRFVKKFKLISNIKKDGAKK